MTHAHECDTALIRVDGSDTIGMGHVMRCLSLVEELARLAPLTPLFIMKDSAQGAGWVEHCGQSVVRLPAGCSADVEVAAVTALVERKRPVCVVTDLRELTPGLVKAVKARGVLSVVIDEWGHRRICADFLTNGTIVPSWHHYEFEGAVQCCLGPAYALLDRQFAQLHGLPRPSHVGPPRVLIALGGDDPFHLTVNMLKVLERIPQPLSTMVVIGPAFTDQRVIRHEAARSRHDYDVRENVSNMGELMLHADLAIVGGGLIALEAACCGTPGLVCCEVPHQLETAAVLEQHGAAVSLGFGHIVNEQATAQVISDLLSDEARRLAMSQAGRRLVDGRGCQRVARALRNAWAVRRAR